MATRKNFLYLGLGGGDQRQRVTPSTNDPTFEFDESDLWNSNSNDLVFPPYDQPISKKSIPPANSKWASRKPLRGDHQNQKQKLFAGTSLPVSVPDWSKILRDEYEKGRRENDDEMDMDMDSFEDDEDRLPPHEYLARTRNASFSVHEGIGRTLKGRDLRRVRNAIWKQTGFED